jgi:hypothetical protein
VLHEKLHYKIRNLKNYFKNSKKYEVWHDRDPLPPCQMPLMPKIGMDYVALGGIGATIHHRNGLTPFLICMSKIIPFFTLKKDKKMVTCLLVLHQYIL